MTFFGHNILQTHNTQFLSYLEMYGPWLATSPKPRPSTFPNKDLHLATYSLKCNNNNDNNNNNNKITLLGVSQRSRFTFSSSSFLSVRHLIASFSVLRIDRILSSPSESSWKP